MGRLHVTVLILLFALLLLCGQSRSVYIDVDQGSVIYTGDDEINITGTVVPTRAYWYDYGNGSFDKGTAYNLTIDNWSIRLDPGLEFNELNGGKAVLSGASGSAWDAHLLQFDVVKVNRTYYLYYVGTNSSSSNGRSQIGLATSTDGLNWTRYASNPVLRSGTDTYDHYGLSDPVVLVENGTWHMWYGGDRNGSSPDIDVCYATSSDGLAWSKYSSNPIMRNDANGSLWNGTELRPQSVIKRGSTYLLYYAAKGSGNLTQLGLMTSSDGKDWNNSSVNPLYDGSSGWEGGRTRYGTIEARGPNYRMWVCGDGSNGWKIGHIYSSGGINWTNASAPFISPRANTSYSKHLMWPALVEEGAYQTLFALGVDASGVSSYVAFRVTPVRLNGTYTSEIKDLGENATLNDIYWWVYTHSYSAIDLYMRYGNSTDAMGSWILIKDRYALVGVVCRYQQYRLEFSVEEDWFWGPRIEEIYCFYYPTGASLSYTFDDGPNIDVTLDNMSCSINLALYEGRHDLRLYAEDSAGNKDSYYSFIIADLSAPTGDILIEWGENTTAHTTVEVLLETDDTLLTNTAYLSNRPDLRGAIDHEVYGGSTVEWEFNEDTEGEVTLYVQYEDRFGRRSPVYNDSIYIDLTPPDATLVINDGEGYANSTDVTLFLNWTDYSGVYLMWVSLDPEFPGVEWTLPVHEVAWTFPEGEGTKRVWIRLVDNLGWTTNISAEIILDQTDPSGTLAVDDDAEYTTETRVEVLMSVQDGSPVGVMFYNLGEPWPDTWEHLPSVFDFPWSLAEGDDGTRTVLMMVRDAAGNSVVVSDDIILDTTPPQGRLLINGGDELTPDQDVRLTIIATDATSGLDAMVVSNTFSFPTSQWQTFKEQLRWAVLLGDGEKRVYVMLRDVAGLTSFVQATIILDSTPPEGEVTIEDGTPWVREPLVTISLAMEDEHGLAAMRFSNTPDMEGSEWVRYRGSVQWDLGDTEGTHTVHVEVRDRVNNTYSTTLWVYLDLTDPTATVLIADGAETTFESILEVTWSASDGNGLSGVRFAYEPTFAGIGWEHPFEGGTKEHSGAAEMFVGAEGERRFYIQVRDLSGRQFTASDTIWYVRSRPEGMLMVGDGSGWTSTADVMVGATWTGESEATHFRVGQVKEEIGSSPWSTIDGAVPLSLRAQSGTQTIFGQLMGPHNVTSFIITTNVTLDLTQPIVLVVEPSKRTTKDDDTLLSLNIIENLDPNVVVRWRVNDGPWHPYTANSKVDLEVGKNVIYVEATDAAGNTGTASYTVVREEVPGMTGTGLVLAAVVVVVILALVSAWYWRSKQRGEGQE